MLKNQFDPPQAPGRVLLLGKRGVVARKLVPYLESRGLTVRALGSDEIDLLAPEAAGRLAAELRPDDALVMLSCLTPDKGRDIATLMKNLRMAEAVAGAFTQRPCAQVIYMSSDAVYSLSHGLIREDTPAEPSDLYGVMHRARELMLASVVPADKLLLLRSSVILAEYDTHNSYGPNRFRRQAQKEGRITLGGEGEETRDHIYVGDVAELIRLALVHRSTGILNGATGQSASFQQVAKLVAAGFTPAPEIIFTPRGAPITHRHFDVTALHQAFPALRMTALGDAVQMARQAEAAS